MQFKEGDKVKLKSYERVTREFPNQLWNENFFNAMQGIPLVVVWGLDETRIRVKCLKTDDEKYISFYIGAPGSDFVITADVATKLSPRLKN